MSDDLQSNMVQDPKPPEGDDAPSPAADSEPHVPWFKRTDPAYDALPSQPIAVHELFVDIQTWQGWARAARDARVRAKRLSNVAAVIVTALLAIPGLVFLPGASKSVVVCLVPFATWGSWRLVRDAVLRRTVSGAVQEMRALMVPALFEYVTDLELLQIAAYGAGPVLSDSKIARVEQRSGDALIAVAEYDLRPWGGYFPTGSSFTM